MQTKNCFPAADHAEQLVSTIVAYNSAEQMWRRSNPNRSHNGSMAFSFSYFSAPLGVELRIPKVGNSPSPGNLHRELSGKVPILAAVVSTKRAYLQCSEFEARRH